MVRALRLLGPCSAVAGPSDQPRLPPWALRVAHGLVAAGAPAAAAAGAAAAVPGILSGLCAAREHWGVLPLEALIDPTIRFLRDGIELTEYQAMCNVVLSGILGVSEFGRAHYFASSGEPLAAGERFCNRELADALQSLATLGLSRFQEEVLFPAVLSDFGEAVGGRITPEDLQRSTPRFREPLSVGYGGAELCTNPPPSFGGRFICQTLELFDRLGVRQSPAGSAEHSER